MKSTEYYVRHDGKLFGPLKEAQIAMCLGKGLFTGNDTFSIDMTTWQSLSKWGKTIMSDDETMLTPENVASNFSQPSFQQDIVNTEQKTVCSRKSPFPMLKKIGLISLGIVAIAALAWGFVWLVGIGEPDNFQEVCEKYQNAVGVVVVTVENTNGKTIELPCGTAFAIAPNTFVTNSHVAYFFKNQKEKIADLIIQLDAKSEAKNDQEYNTLLKKYTRERKQEYLNNIYIRNVEIRLSHCDGKSLAISGVIPHARYSDGIAPDQEYKNAEYDIALLTTDEPTDVYFSIATKKQLYSLRSGTSIGYLGFPMEGLGNDGELDLHKPEAAFKDGAISKIIDFDNKSSKPEYTKSIIHTIPSAGGASGSPIFLNDGKVVAILWGGSNIGLDANGARISSAAQHNYALRIDALEDLQKKKEIPIDKWVGNEKN